MKATRNRDCERRLILLDMLRNRYDHPSAADCVKTMRKLVPSIGASTVYRHLAELVSADLIVRYRPGNGSARFDAAVHEHAHFYCTKCKKMSDVETIKVSGKWPGSVQNINCLAKGVCDECGLKECRD